MQQISVIIADDESLAREGLALRLQQASGFEIQDQCHNGTLAYQSIIQHLPDVVFLDIEMPGINGLELIRKLNLIDSYEPKIIFVTAYQDFALKAFDYKAFDYLLKPFSEERLSRCLKNVCIAIEERNAKDKQASLDKMLSRKTGKSLDSFIHSLESASQTNLDELKHTISMKSGTQWLRIHIDSILWIEAAGDYLCVHTTEQTHIVRKTLRQLESELDASHFPRMNRSSIVNMSKVTHLTPNSNGEYIATLITGTEVKVGRKYKMKLDELSQ
ncbi:LytTR family DNA-binding domain-containing protein [Aliiglaciecola sp.]|nr:LytTR family DNA-binding domain-containing protein [Aliiglaciecola sp.]